MQGFIVPINSLGLFLLLVELGIICINILSIVLIREMVVG